MVSPYIFPLFPMEKFSKKFEEQEDSKFDIALVSPTLDLTWCGFQTRIEEYGMRMFL